MAISASTSGKNRIFKSIRQASMFDDAKNVISSAISFNQGDLMFYDAAAKLIKKVAATGDAATFIGIADETVVSGKKSGPYDGLTAVNAAEAIASVHGPVYAVIATMKLKLGDTFNPGDKVYLADGLDTQTVSSVDPGDANFIGIFQDPLIVAGALSVGNCLLGSRYAAGLDY